MNHESRPLRPADLRSEQTTVGSIYAGRVKGAPPPSAVPTAPILDLGGESIAAHRDRHSLNAPDGSKEAVR
jgi:hypothetical protein